MKKPRGQSDCTKLGSGGDSIGYWGRVLINVFFYDSFSFAVMGYCECTETGFLLYL